VSNPATALKAAFDAMLVGEMDRFAQRLAERVAVDHIEYQQLVDSGDEAGSAAFVDRLAIRLRGKA
jgi:hypothetical protein